MRPRLSAPTKLFLLFFLILFTPATLKAAVVTITVNPDDPNCSNTSDPPCFTSIQPAIDEAARLASLNTGTTYSVLVEPSVDNYAGGITLKTEISVRGRETATTIIAGGGTGTLMTATDVTGVSIRNFTFQASSFGIQVAGNSNIDIENNIFDVGSGSTAVQILSSAGSSIINNTFYQNGTAISRDNDSVEITNNIFYNSSNTVQISQTAGLAETTIKNNLFFSDTDGPKGTGFIPNATITSADPLFVAPSEGDFHIKFNSSPSPAIDNGLNTITDIIDGSASDLGAYGGTNADTIPFIVSGVTVTADSATSALVSWSPNNSYVVTNTDTAKQGGYNVHYNLSKEGPPYDNVVTAESTSTSAVISGLTATSTPPAAPVLNQPAFADRTLILSWSSVQGATKYIVHYADLDLASSITNTVDVGNTTGYDLTGLINGHDYAITISAVAQPVYHFSVTAFDYTVAAGEGEPGVSNESQYSEEVKYPVGTAMESELSNEVIAFPEPLVPNPNLPNSGCFIATAAYGYYSAPQVQALRDFRDQYLLTNRAGRAFVDWYYRYGPMAAAFINNEPWLKPIVRTALLPAVAGAWFMVHSPFPVKIAVILLIGFLVPASVIIRKTYIRNGGVR